MEKATCVLTKLVEGNWFKLSKLDILSYASRNEKQLLQ